MGVERTAWDKVRRYGKETVLAALGLAGEKTDLSCILHACGVRTLLVRQPRIYDSAIDWEGNSDTPRDQS